MPVPNTQESSIQELSNLGLESGLTVMVHSALGKIGWTVDGPVAVIRALLVIRIYFSISVKAEFKNSIIPFGLTLESPNSAVRDITVQLP